MDNLVDLVKNMSISGGLDASRLSNEDDENKLANPVGVTLMSDRNVQLYRNRSRFEGNIGEEIKDVRPILSSVTDVWDDRSKVVTEDQSGLGELGKRKTKPTPRWIAYQLDELEKKRSRLNKKMIRKSSAVEGMLYSFKNLESVRDQMQQLDDIFKMMFEVHKEYNSMLQPDAQETDEEWFDDVEHNLCAFKQKIHNWMKDAEAERKIAVSSRLSDASVGRRGSSLRSISKYSSRSGSKQSTNSSHKSSREDRALEEKIKMAELIAEAEFMEKRQTLEQQAQRLKIATEVAKSKARVKLLENTREVNGKVDTV